MAALNPNRIYNRDYYGRHLPHKPINKGGYMQQTQLKNRSLSKILLFLLASTVPTIKSHADNYEFEIQNKNESPSREVRSMKEIKKLSLTGSVNAVRWSSDGSKLAVLDNFGSHISVYEKNRWTLINSFNRYSGSYPANSFGFLPDGTLLTPTPNGRYPEDEKYRNGLVDGMAHETLSSFSLMQWNYQKEQAISYYPKNNRTSISENSRILPGWIFSNSLDGKFIASTNGPSSKTINIFDLGFLKHQIKLDEGIDVGLPRSIAFSPDGSLIALGLTSGRVILFNTGSGKIISQLSLYQGQNIACSSISFSPDGKYILVGRSKNYNLVKNNMISADIVDLQSSEIKQSLAGNIVKVEGILETPEVNSVAWSNDGNFIAVGDGISLMIWARSAENFMNIVNSKKAGGFYSVSFSPDGELAAGNSNNIYIYQ